MKQTERHTLSLLSSIALCIDQSCVLVVQLGLLLCLLTSVSLVGNTTKLVRPLQLELRAEMLSFSAKVSKMDTTVQVVVF